ncbi:antitermination protein, partial [Serratia marcescens]|uniref:bacteriophage antitermination protein Q n=1 Tax=Serratia marcescens TaxID=615 RepID=UPI00332D2EB2
MNAQQLEYIRLELTNALHDDSGSTKGQLQAFIEHPPADKNHYPRQRIHKVELEGERWADAENSAVYALETRSRRRPMPPINDHVFSSCAWRRAVMT